MRARGVAVLALSAVIVAACGGSSVPAGDGPAPRPFPTGVDADPVFRAAGSLPPVPGPVRHGPVTAVAGASIAVFGGAPDGSTTYDLLPGGYLLAGDATAWQPLRGVDLPPLVNLQAVTDGTRYVLIGTRCSKNLDEFVAEHEFDHSQPCGEQPLVAYLVDGAGVVSRLADPGVEPAGEELGPPLITALGIVDGQWYFQVQPRTGHAEPTFRLLGLDPTTGRWSDTTVAGGDFDGTVCAVADGIVRYRVTDFGAADRPLQVRSWRLRPAAGEWRRQPDLETGIAVKDGSVAPRCARSGPLVATGRTSTGDTFAYRQEPSGDWTELPAPPSWVGDALRVGDDLVMWSSDADPAPAYSLLPAGVDAWSVTTTTVGRATAIPYGPDSVLASESATNARRPTMTIVPITGSG